MLRPDPPSDDVVDLAELRICLNMIFDHLEKDLAIKNIKIPENKNFYWDINIDHLFDVRGNKPDFGMGSTIDDLAFLRKMSEDSNLTHRAPALMLMHLTPILNLVCDIVRA